MTENGSHVESCVIRLHCVALCPLTEYGFSFSSEEGAITKSLKSMREFLDKLLGHDQHFELLQLHYTSSVHNARSASSQSSA